MPLPSPLETVTVRGSWVSPVAGTPLAGTVTLRAVNEVRSAAGNVLVTTTPERRSLVAGAAEWTQVLYTDSAGLSSPVTYQVEVFGLGHHEKRFVQLVKATAVAGVIQLADVVTLESPPVLVAYVLASTVGQVGGPAGPLGLDGKVPTAQLPAGGGGGAVASVDGRVGVVTLGDLYTDPAELAAGLATKANTVHTHTASNVTDFTTAVDARVQLIVDAAPAALDTLNELAAAIGDDANFAGTVTSALAGKQPLDSDLTAIAALSPADGALIQRVAGAWNSQTAGQVKTSLGLVKGDVGLSSVDNTADTAKPVSTAAQAALDLKAPLASPAFSGTPTGITKAHVGLGNADNTSDLGKPISTATQAALDGKAALAHKHVYDRLLDAYGFVGVSGDPAYFGASAGPGNSDHLIGLVPAQAGVSIGSVKIANQAAATYSATATPAQVLVYDFDGALLGSSPDDATLWLAAGWRTATLSAPITVPANGLLFIGLSFGGFSGAQPAIQPGNQHANVTAGLVGGRRRSIYGSSGAGLPASFSPASYGLATTWYVLMGVVPA